MKTAVVYYSLDGNCAFVAEEVKSLFNAELIRLQTKDEKKRRGFAKYFWGGGMVFAHKKPPLKPYAFDPAAYELIVIGAPVWAGSPAPPIQTFLSESGMSGKKIALFVCHGGGKGNALGTLKNLLAGNEIIAEADFVNARKNSAEVKRQIADWVKGLQGK
ncbi:MAG: flavodoxin [Spirochaetaceae bacterium]|jgi:flavodoxin|nr:flavodoxin [Spirochaetaceae bacterium]